MDIFEFLEAQGIVAERHSHPPVMTVEESLRLVPKLRGLKTKNLFLRDKRGRRHLLVTVPHDLSVDLDALGVSLDAHRLGFASAERLSKHLGIRPGSVSLLALFNDKAGAVEFVIDRRLWDADAVQAHPLVNSETLGSRSCRPRALSRRHGSSAAGDRRSRDDDAGKRIYMTQASPQESALTPLVRLVDHTEGFAVEILGERRPAQRVAHALYDPSGARMRAS